MKTNKTVAYALACLHELAKKTGQFVQVSEVALAQQIPQAYCQKILLALSRAGLAVSVKGKGFMLIQPFEEITALDVILALDDPQEINEESLQTGVDGIINLLSDRVQKVMAGLRIAEVMSGVS